MSKVVRNIQTQQVDEQCSSCGKGFMRPTGISLLSTPPQYEHKCTNCSHKQHYSVRYPHVVSY